MSFLLSANDTADFQVVFGGTLIGSILYWIFHQALESSLSAISPTTYARLNKDRMFGLHLCVTMAIRGFIGILITVPSCTIATLTTPWGYKQPLNNAGAVCVVSQAIPFMAELHLQVDTNAQLLIHHLISLMIVGNVVSFPEIHMMKPLYIFLASQFGDVTIALYKCFKAVGYKVHDSWIAFVLKLATTLILVLSKTAAAFYCASRVFTSPQLPVNWIWIFSMGFFSMYNVNVACFNLRYIGLLTLRKCSQGFSSVTLFHYIQTSRFAILSATAALVAILTGTLFYASLLPGAILPGELNTIWLFMAASLLCISVLTMMSPRACMRFCPEIRSGMAWLSTSPCLRISSVVYMGMLQKLLRIQDSVVDTSVLTASMVISLVVWDGLMRIAIWSSPESQEPPPQPVALNNGQESSRAGLQTLARPSCARGLYHLRMMWMDAGIALSGCIFATKMTVKDATALVLLTYSMLKCSSDLTVLIKRDKHNVQSTPRSVDVLHSLFSSGELCLAILVVRRLRSTGSNMDSEVYLCLRALHLAVCIITSSCCIPLVIAWMDRRKLAAVQRVAHGSYTKTPDNVQPAARGTVRVLRGIVTKFLGSLVSPMGLTSISAFVIQYLALQPVMCGDDYSVDVPAQSVGFRNAVVVMQSLPFIIMGVTALQMGTLGLWYSSSTTRSPGRSSRT